jgi:hypothetical protein
MPDRVPCASRKWHSSLGTRFEEDRLLMSKPSCWLAIGATALLLQACAQQAAPGSGTRRYAADLAGGAKRCTVSKVTPAPGQQADATMQVDNEGGWCAITVDNGGRPYGAGLLVGEPAHGKILIHTVGDTTRIDYTPDARFTGADTFTVKLVPGDATIKTTVAVQ